MFVCPKGRARSLPLKQRPAKAIKGNFRKGVTLSEWQQRKLILAAALGKDLRGKKSGEEAFLKGSSDCTIYTGEVVKMEMFRHTRVICFKLLWKLSCSGSFNQILFFICLPPILLNLAFIKTYSKSL